MAMQFDASSAQRLLTAANTHFAAMLPAVNGLQGQPDGHAQSYVAAVQALQQQLAAFAAPTPGTQRAALEAQVSALEQELSRADALLRETSVLTQQWQMRCRDLHKQHEEVLTKGIGTQTAPAAAVQQAPQDTTMEDAQT